MVRVSVVDDDVGSCSIGFNGVDVVIVPSDNGYVRISRRKGLWHSTKEHGNVVLGVPRGNRVQDRAANVARTAGAAWNVNIGYILIYRETFVDDLHEDLGAHCRLKCRDILIQVELLWVLER